MQRILRYIASRKTPASAAEVTAAMASQEVEVIDAGKLALSVSANLSQLFAKKKLARTGKSGAFRYSPTATTLVDGRKFTAAGKPRNTKQLERAKPSKSAPAKAAPTPAQRLAVANIGKPAPRKPGERETVEQFIARGGKVQLLKQGESSGPIYQTARDLNATSMRKRLATIADNDETNDDELSVA